MSTSTSIRRPHPWRHVEKRVDVVGLARTFEQGASPRLAQISEDVLAAGERPRVEDAAPILGDENQVIHETIDSVEIAVKCLLCHVEPIILPGWFASTAIASIQVGRSTWSCSAFSGCFASCTTPLSSIAATCTDGRARRSRRTRRCERSLVSERCGLNIRRSTHISCRMRSHGSTGLSALSSDAVRLGISRLSSLQRPRPIPDFHLQGRGHNNGVRLAVGGKRVKLAGIGNVKLKLHRPVEGRIKQASVTLSGDGHWYVAFACDGVQPNPLPATGASIGVDVGITTFAALSNGELVANPRPYETAQRALGKAQRVVSRRKRGSHRRRKAVRRLAKRHDKVTRVRRDFHHKTALDLVRRFDVIAVENLNVKGLAQMALAKQVHDAGWASFTNIIRAKAEKAGREVVAVDPRGTSPGVQRLRCRGQEGTRRAGTCLHVRARSGPRHQRCDQHSRIGSGRAVGEG